MPIAAPFVTPWLPSHQTAVTHVVDDPGEQETPVIQV